MSKVTYLTNLVDAKTTADPRYGKTQSGYTLLAGSPTRYMIKTGTERRWRRVMALCFSNCASHFVWIQRRRVFLSESHLDSMAEKVRVQEGVNL